MAETVAPYSHLPAVKSAKSLRKAYNIVLDQKKAHVAHQLRKLNAKTSQHKLIHGDFFEISKTLPKGYFDVLISDPPYGINADQQSFEKRHTYDDSPTAALRLYQEILRKGFHLLKPQGHLFLFCDVEHFTTIRTYAEQQAFSTWRTPIIWFKGPEGPAPWGKSGFCRTYELLLFATKGQRPLCIGPESDVHLAKRTNRTDRRHAAEKPPELMRWLLQLTCTPGTDCKVLDPCAGSGPLLEAAKNLDIELTLVEQSEEHYASLCLRAQEVESGDEELPDQVEHDFTKEELDEDIFGQ
jgi:site-specific DNA-methyltransferase (adenine-specific)